VGVNASQVNRIFQVVLEQVVLAPGSSFSIKQVRVENLREEELNRYLSDREVGLKAQVTLVLDYQEVRRD
jgi:hypothetical protein